MRYAPSPLLILAILLASAACADDQWDNRNAATWYRKLVGLLSWDYEAELAVPPDERLLTDDELNLIGDYWFGTSGETSPELRNALAKAKPVMDLVRRGSQQREHCRMQP